MYELAKDSRWYTLDEIAQILRYIVLKQPELTRAGALSYINILVDDGFMERRATVQDKKKITIYRTK